MFSDPAAFERYRQQTGQKLDIEMMRRDLGPGHFCDAGEATNLPWPAPWSGVSSDSQRVGQDPADGP